MALRRYLSEALRHDSGSIWPMAPCFVVALRAAAAGHSTRFPCPNAANCRIRELIYAGVEHDYLTLSILCAERSRFDVRRRGGLLRAARQSRPASRPFG